MVLTACSNISMNKYQAANHVLETGSNEKKLPDEEKGNLRDVKKTIQRNTNNTTFQKG